MIEAAHGFGLAVAANPWTAVEARVFCRVDAQCRRECAELSPSRREFGIGVASEAADVVGPVVAAALSAAGGQFDLEGENLPVGLGVA